MYHTARSYATTFQPNAKWIMDTGAASHVTGDPGTLTSYHPLLAPYTRHIIVGNGSYLPVLAVGTTHLPPKPFYLRHILLSPNIVKNLISVRKFTRDNLCYVEFDPLGFSMKDLATKEVLLRVNSDGDLYPFSGNNGIAPTVVLTISMHDLWHRRLGHPGSSTFSPFSLDFLTACNNDVRPSHLCSACQMGKHTRLPFSTSTSYTTTPSI